MKYCDVTECIIINAAIRHAYATHKSQCLPAYIKTPPQVFQHTIYYLINFKVHCVDRFYYSFKPYFNTLPLIILYKTTHRSVFMALSHICSFLDMQSA